MSTTPLALAMQYLDIFYSGENLHHLRNILDGRCRFTGPFIDCHSADEYVQALLSDPPASLNYTVLQTYEQLDSACVIYQFEKDDVSTPMAQLFETNGSKIKRILLIFDSAAFAAQAITP